MKFCLGPMSKNIVDSILDYAEKNGTEITLIPSRRQVDIHGGYVNQWTTKEFCEYVKSRNVPTIRIQRDHGGPGQGDKDDDGVDSLLEDVKYMDSIHIDPWKKYPKYEDGLEWTIKLITLCYQANPRIEYEVGTEEGIRPMLVEDLEKLCKDLKEQLQPVIFQQIKFAVIQCGTQLLEKENIGNFDEAKLLRMLKTVRSYGIEPKEHNGDWISAVTVQRKEKLGLRYINVAPEMGELETKVILDYVKGNAEHFERLYRICYESGRWRKWVSPEFNPEKNKTKLILICGHYIFSNEEFIQMKSFYKGIEEKIQKVLKDRLDSFFGNYMERKKCLMCECEDFEIYFQNDLQSTLSFHFLEKKTNLVSIPFNILSCANCNTIQTKYLGDLNIIYGMNHVDAFGSTKQKMINAFSDFVCENKDIHGIVEVGTPTCDLAEAIAENLPVEYTIIEPDYKGKKEKVKLIDSFVENVDLSSLSANTIILSHVFEHLYEPLVFLEKLAKSNLQYVYLNHPNFEYYCNNNVYNILNIEHISYFEEDFLKQLFKNYGFETIRRKDYESHSILLEMKRINEVCKGDLINKTAVADTKRYFKVIRTKIEILNDMFTKNEKKYFLWPASAHNITLLTMGLNPRGLEGFLDNSPNKIGKYLSGYNIPCLSFTSIIDSDDDNNVVIIGCSGNYVKELDLDGKKTKFIFLEDLV